MGDKVPALSDLATSKGIDLLGMTKTWLTTKETSADLAEITPQVFSFFHEPRARWRVGGVGLFVSLAHKFSTISLPAQTSFEDISAKLKCGQSYLIALSIYRPPGPATTLFSELQDILYYICTLPHDLALMGGLQSSYKSLITRCWTAIWYVRGFRSPSIRWLSYPHTLPFSGPYDLFFRMQCFLCFGLWFDFGTPFSCCWLANSNQP